MSEQPADRRMAIFTMKAKERIAEDEKLPLASFSNDQLIELCKERQAEWIPKKRIENHNMWAGEPMFFYCWSCKINHVILPEDYLDDFCKLCVVCDEMVRRGLSHHLSDASKWITKVSTYPRRGAWMSRSALTGKDQS